MPPEMINFSTPSGECCQCLREAPYVRQQTLQRTQPLAAYHSPSSPQHQQARGCQAPASAAQPIAEYQQQYEGTQAADGIISMRSGDPLAVRHLCGSSSPRAKKKSQAVTCLQVFYLVWKLYSCSKVHKKTMMRPTWRTLTLYG